MKNIKKFILAISLTGLVSVYMPQVFAQGGACLSGHQITYTNSIPANKNIVMLINAPGGTKVLASGQSLTTLQPCRSVNFFLQNTVTKVTTPAAIQNWNYGGKGCTPGSTFTPTSTAFPTSYPVIWTGKKTTCASRIVYSTAVEYYYNHFYNVEVLP